LDKALEFLLGLLQGHPVWAGLTAIAIIAVHYGPAYINAISSAVSQKRRDDAELSAMEHTLRKRIEAERQKRTDSQ
jgi:hypothetical protein